MTLVATLSSRLVSSVRLVVRVAVQRFGIGPVVLAAAALAAALLSWRYRPRHEDEDGGVPRRRRRRALNSNNNNDDDENENTDYGTTTATASLSNGAGTTTQRHRSSQQQHQVQHQRASRNNGNVIRKPQWLSRVRRVSIGAICSPSHPCNLFALDVVMVNNCKETVEEETKNSKDNNTKNDVQLEQQHDTENSTINNVTKDNGNTSNGNDKLPSSSSSSSSSSQQTNNKITAMPKVTVSPDTLVALRQFATLFDVYLVIRVDTDEMETAVTTALSEAGLFDTGLLDKRKVVFCETDTGRISVARQLESQLHIDESFDVILGLQRFVQCVGFISPDAPSFPADLLGRNVMLFNSLMGFFTS